MEIETSQPAPEQMIVDGSPSPPTGSQDHYTIEDHTRMDQEVKATLEEDGTLWRENPSGSELRFVLQTVVKGDPRLDQKFLLNKKFPNNLRTTLSGAWQAMSFQRIRILSCLQAPKTESEFLQRHIVVCPYTTYTKNLTQAERAALGEAMTRDYKGASVDAFIQYLEQNNIAFNLHDNTYYAKFCSITQSSGVGKTRLLFELGKKDICVLYINIRSEKDAGYPPRDTIPANLLTEVFPTVELYRHRCRTFFATVFKCLAIFLREESDPFGVLSDVENKRRTKFFEDVKKNFANVEQEYSESSDVMCVYFKEMVDTARLFRRNENKPKVVIALDEAHVLYERSKNQDYLPAIVFLQTIKEYSDMFKPEPVWVVFASTAAKVAHYASPQALFPSARVALEAELLFPPFTQLGWDQYVPVLKEVELDKVAWGSHLLQYGRPLWWSLRGHRPLPKIVDLAAQKLCVSRTFQSNSDVHAFAIIGQRFGLDIAFGHRKAVQYNDTFIANHLRICVKTTGDRMWGYASYYPSEPIVSAAAADLLYEQEENLSTALKNVSLMVNNGLINTGDTGELASRVLWLLAKDSCVRKGFAYRSSPPSTNNGVSGDYELPYCRLVPVVTFLEVLFGSEFWNKAGKARKVFQDAYIDFTHWVQMGFDITRGNGDQNDISIEEWTESLWARTSAIQCCHNQPIIDKVIPMYFKSRPRGSNMSHILISDKARDCPGRKLVRKITRKHRNITPHFQGPPYIAIVADLGLSSSDLAVYDRSKTEDPCLRIYVAGLNKETYPFLEEDIAGTLRDLYDARQSVPSVSEDLENEVQYGWSREARYMNGKEEEAWEGINWDEPSD